MFRAYNYFRRHNKNKEIKDYKNFYKHFSNKAEFGGKHTHLDYLINNRFLETYSFVMATILRAQPKNILDLGCGAGVYLPLSGMFPNIAYHGVDYAENSIAAAKRAYPNVVFSVGDLFDFETPKKADLVILSLVLILYEEEVDRDKILSTLRKNLSANGYGVVVVWNDLLFIRICHYLSRIFAHATGTPLPKDFMCLYFNEKEMRREFFRNELEVVDVKHTSPRYGALECAQYLSLQKYRRDFSRETQLNEQKMSLNEFEDFCKEAKSDSFWIKLLYKVSFLIPSFFSMHSIYLVKNDVIRS